MNQTIRVVLWAVPCLALLAVASSAQPAGRELKVAVAQPMVTPGDVSGNIDRMGPLLAEAEECQRSELAGMEPAAGWAELKRRAKTEAEYRAAAEREEAAKRCLVVDATIEANRGKRIWRLTGLFLEDRSMARYTLNELERWLDWAKGYLQFRRGNFDVRVEAEGERGAIVAIIDWTAHFTERSLVDRKSCAVFTDESFDAMCRDLAAFTEERRQSAAPNN